MVQCSKSTGPIVLASAEDEGRYMLAESHKLSTRATVENVCSVHIIATSRRASFRLSGIYTNVQFTQRFYLGESFVESAQCQPNGYNLCYSS